MPGSLEAIKVNAFRESGLEEFTAPPSLKTISQGVFYKCDKLRRAVLNEGLEALGTNEYWKDGTKHHGIF